PSNNEIVFRAAFGYLREIDRLTTNSSGRFIISNDRQVARLNADLTLDKSFAPGGARQLGASDFTVAGINALTVLSNGRTVMASDFGSGRGSLFSFRPDTTVVSGTTLNRQGTLFVTGTDGNDVVEVRRVGFRIYVSMNGTFASYGRAEINRIAA